MPLSHVCFSGIDSSVEPGNLDALVDQATAAGTLLSLAVHYCPSKMGAMRMPTTDYILGFLEWADKNTVQTEIHLADDAIAAFADRSAPIHDLIRRFDRALIQAQGITQYELARDINQSIACTDQVVTTRHWIGSRDLWHNITAPNHRVLIDSSRGRGLLPREWQTHLPEKRCGYAGGITPANCHLQLPEIAQAAGGNDYFVHVETAIRDGQNHFSVDQASDMLAAIGRSVRRSNCAAEKNVMPLRPAQASSAYSFH